MPRWALWVFITLAVIFTATQVVNAVGVNRLFTEVRQEHARQCAEERQIVIIGRDAGVAVGQVPGRC